MSSGPLNDFIQAVWRHAMFFLRYFFVHVGVVGHNRLPFAGMLSLHETQEWLFGLENITTASIDIRMNYPFKLDLLSVAL